MQHLRPSILLLFSLVLCLSLLACSSTHNPWYPQDQEQYLAEKIKSNRNAYLRYSQAEEDARKDGMAEAVEQFGRAKESARQELARYEAELAAYQSSKGTSAHKPTP
ncbi:hypothetical protein [Desulfovibrio sp. TomC]|uniref:hypothetical protein n=1 Tax=Desulfovibrio sp. TomC TaxID=1562888 RepID=UPI0005735435|nr:hypothetical protein [Desulfovibrio sp. TomC]KHK01548.1 hypothetical protein NY78_3069 [Desulfovibrio sp. TomC]